jgi:hypothetical protein
MKEIGRNGRYFNGQNCCILEFFQFQILLAFPPDCCPQQYWRQFKEREN